jgi:hypothetical protein
VLVDRLADCWVSPVIPCAISISDGHESSHEYLPPLCLRDGCSNYYHEELKAAGVDVDAEIGRMGDPVALLLWLRDPEVNS